MSWKLSSRRALQFLLFSASICISTAAHAQSKELIKVRWPERQEPLPPLSEAEKKREAAGQDEAEKKREAAGQEPLPRYIAGQQGPAGGHGGSRCESFDVPTDWRLASINVWSGHFIDRIELSYDVAGAPELRQPPACGGTGGKAGRLLTIDPDESIVRVMGKWSSVPSEGVFHGPESAAISYLYVQTSKGKTRDFGNGATKGIVFDYIAVEGTEIAGLIVNSGTLVNALGVVLRKTRNRAQMKLPVRVRQ